MSSLDGFDTNEGNLVCGKVVGMMMRQFSIRSAKRLMIRNVYIRSTMMASTAVCMLSSKPILRRNESQFSSRQAHRNPVLL